MLLLGVSSLPETDEWLYELKLDGCRAIAFKADGEVFLRSRNNKDFSERHPDIAAALERLPDQTVIDGEIVALDSSGRPSFRLLQNGSSSSPQPYFYVFDLLVLSGRDMRNESLSDRRRILKEKVLPRMREPIRFSPEFTARLPDLLRSVRAQRLEGLVAKRKDSLYESGQRTGAWLKMRVNQAQEFVIGGYTIGSNTFDALIFGYYDGASLLYASRTRNGFTPASRQKLAQRFRGLETVDCPFGNLPEAKAGRWGVGLTTKKMKDCRWLKPELVAHIEFTEWTADNRLRHSQFVALRDDKLPQTVRKEV